MQQFVLFQINTQCFALPIEKVMEITDLKAITRFPGSSNHIEGLIHLRGKVIPVITLAQLFGCELINERERQQILIVHEAGREVGLIIDMAKDVKVFEDSQIKPLSSMAKSKDSVTEFSVIDEGEIIIAISLSNLIALLENDFQVFDALKETI